MADKPYLKGANWTIDKDPEDKRYYVGNVARDLVDSNTTLKSVEVIVAGVTLLEGPVIQGTEVSGGNLIVVKLGGMDTSPAAVASGGNYVTFRCTCNNGEQFDRTIFFNRVDN